MVCFVLLICVFWFCYAVVINIWIHFCVFFLFCMIVSSWIMKFLNVSTIFDHDSFVMSKRFTSYSYFKKKKLISVDINSYLFNVNSVIEHNLIQFFWSYDVKVLIYIFLILFVFFRDFIHLWMICCQWFSYDFQQFVNDFLNMFYKLLIFV